ncbi:MAG: methyltransferase [Myxococcota bacterium]
MGRILIVGAGLTGSLLAICLSRRGHRVDVFERHAALPTSSESKRSALNITICERGLDALGRVGLRDRVLSLAVPARGRIVHTRDGGVTYQPYGNHGEAIYSVSRAALNHVLVQQASQESNVQFHFEHRFVQLDPATGSARFEVAGAQTREVIGDCTIGADGAFSGVRAQLTRTEHFNYSQQYWRQGGYKSLWLPANADGSPALEGEALHIWPRGSRMLMGFPNRDGSATLSLLLPFRGVGSYEGLIDAHSVETFFQAQFADVASKIPSLGEQFFAKPINPLLTVRCDPWSMAGRVLLIGDAAHALLPSYGQGANAGFEDCAVLDECLQQYGDDWSGAFREFEERRRSSLDIMAELCVEHFEELTDHVADPSFLRRRELERELADLYPELYRPLYSMVSFTTLPYAEAFRIEQRQRRAVDSILSIEGSDLQLGSDRVRRILEASLRSAEPAEASSAASEQSPFELGMSFWGAKALLSAVELGLFAELAAGPRSADELTVALGLHPRGARDFFDALTALGLLTRTGEHYANASSTRESLVPGSSSYIGGALELANARLYPVWSKLSQALRTGLPQNEAQRVDDYYANLTQDPDRLSKFLKAMSGLSLMASRALARSFEWTNYTTFADIGGAQGVLPVELANVHPHLVGINFDLPPVRPVFEEYVREAQLEQRLEFRAGDFFVDPLPRADVIIMGHVLHNWDLDQKRQLIAKAFDALPPGGALVVYEALIDDDRRSNAFGLLMSLNMLLVTTGGFVFTGRDCQAWMLEAGFRRTLQRHLHGPDSMVVGFK